MSLRILDFSDGFSSASEPTSATLGSISMGGNYIYLYGDATTEGSVRLSASSGQAQIEIYSGGSWNLAETFVIV